MTGCVDRGMSSVSLNVLKPWYRLESSGVLGQDLSNLTFVKLMLMKIGCLFQVTFELTAHLSCVPNFLTNFFLWLWSLGSCPRQQVISCVDGGTSSVSFDVTKPWYSSLLLPKKNRPGQPRFSIREPRSLESTWDQEPRTYVEGYSWTGVVCKKRMWLWKL